MADKRERSVSPEAGASPPMKKTKMTADSTEGTTAPQQLPFKYPPPAERITFVGGRHVQVVGTPSPPRAEASSSREIQVVRTPPPTQAAASSRRYILQTDDEPESEEELSMLDEPYKPTGTFKMPAAGFMGSTNKRDKLTRRQKSLLSAEALAKVCLESLNILDRI